MRNLFLLLMVGGLIAFCTGCVQINSSDAGSMNFHPVTTGPTDDYRPVYEVGKEKVSARSDVKCLFWIFTWGSDNAYADNVKLTKHPLAHLFPFLNARQTAAQAAFYKACKLAGCDAVVGARYEITFEDYLFYKKMSVEVKGFPAFLKGVEEVKVMPFYVEGDGKVVTLPKMVKPMLIYDAHKGKGAEAESKGLLTRIVEFFFGI